MAIPETCRITAYATHAGELSQAARRVRPRDRILRPRIERFSHRLQRRPTTQSRASARLEAAVRDHRLCRAPGAATRLRAASECAPIRALVSPIFFAILAPEASFAVLSWTAIADTLSSRKVAPHPHLPPDNILAGAAYLAEIFGRWPAHSDDRIFADEAHSIHTSGAAKAAASVQAANLSVARSAPGAS